MVVGRVEKKVEVKQNLVKGAMILSIGAMLSKIIGLVYRIPLNMIIGDVGNGLYSSVYQVYLIILTLTASAIPAGLSKLIAEREAVGQHKEAEKVFKLTLKCCLICAFILAVVVCAGANYISDVFFPDQNVGTCIRILVPTILIATMVANLRGYFQGMGNMLPTARSMVIEQIVHVILTVALAYWLMHYSMHAAVSGATLGTSIGSLVALVILFASYLKLKKQRKPLIEGQVHVKEEKDSKLLKEIMVIIIPIIISSSVFSIMGFIDLSMMANFLPESLSKLKTAGMLDIVPVPNVDQYTMSELATSLQGQYGYQYTTFINIPVCLIVQLAAAVIPAVAAAQAVNDREEVNNKICDIFKLGMLIGAPVTVAFFLFGKPLVNLALFSNTGGELLSAGALSLIFITLAQLSAAVVQALGKPVRVTVHAILACLIKVGVNYMLIRIPGVHIYGVIYGTTICYFLYAAFNIVYLYTHFKLKVDWMQCVIRPSLCAVIMGIISYICYEALLQVAGSMKLSMMVTIMIAMIVYFVTAIVSKTITKADVMQLPGGSKLEKFVKA